MTCDPIALTELFFDELPADQAATLQRHAHGCAACTRQLDELRAERERFLARRSAPPAFDRLFRGIQQQLEQQRAPRAPRRWMLPNLLRFAAGALALVLAVFATAPRAHHAAFAHPVAQIADSSLASDASLEGANPLETQLAACLITAPPDAQSAEACF